MRSIVIHQRWPHYLVYNFARTYALAMDAKPFLRYILACLSCFHYFSLSGPHFVFTHVWCRGSVSLEHRPMLLWSFRRSFAIFPRRKPLLRERYFTGAGYHVILGENFTRSRHQGRAVSWRKASGCFAVLSRCCFILSHIPKVLNTLRAMITKIVLLF